MSGVDWTGLPEVRSPDAAPLFLGVTLPADVLKMLDDPARPALATRAEAYPQAEMVVKQSRAYAAWEEARDESARLAGKIKVALGDHADTYAVWAISPPPAARTENKQRADAWWAALSARDQSKARDYVDAWRQTRDGDRHRSRVWNRVMDVLFAEADAAKQAEEDAAGYSGLDLPGEPGESLAEISKRTGRSPNYCRKALAAGIDAGAITIGERPGARGQTTKVYWTL